jgi:F0F1-type ATP synthase assembly protein I
MASETHDRDGSDDGDAAGRSGAGMWRFAAIGAEFFSPILGGAIGGYYLDLYFGTQPVLAVAGVFLGMALGFYRLIVELRDFQKRL